MDFITISDDTSPSSSKSALNLPNLRAKNAPSIASLPITIESGSTQRCPVTWYSSIRRQCAVAPQFIGSNVTPYSRVNQWLASTMQIQEAVTETVNSSHHISCDGSESGVSSSVIDEYFNRKQFCKDSPKRNILIRHDFDKDDEIVSNVCSYKPQWKYNGGDNTLNKYYNESKCVNDSNKEIDNLIDENIDVADVGENSKKYKQKFDNSEVPLSPETQKKNELCSYLQLMNMSCTDQKMANKIQNRRSTRVKNLIIMSQKKELERRLNCEAKEKEKDSENHCTDTVNSEDKRKLLTSKSFSELNMCLDTENHQEVKLLNVQNVPPQILEKHTDFDDTIKSFISVEQYNGKRRDLSAKKLEKHPNKSLQDKTYMKKTKKHINNNFYKLNSPQSTLSSSVYRKKLRMLDTRRDKKNAPLLKARIAKVKRYKCMMLRHSSRQNLRSKISLSQVGIKTLILKDKRYEKDVKIRSVYKRKTEKVINGSHISTSNGTSVFTDIDEAKIGRTIKKNQRKSIMINGCIRNVEVSSDTSTSSMSPKSSIKQRTAEVALENVGKYEQARKRLLDALQKQKMILNQNLIEKVQVNKKRASEDLKQREKIVISCKSPVNKVKGKKRLLDDLKRQKPIDRDKIFDTHDNVSKIIPKSNQIRTEKRDKRSSEGVEEQKKISNDQEFQQINTRKLRDFILTKKDFEKPTKEPICEERAFSVIDLSHSRSGINVDTLSDHNYTLKSQSDKGYIMNVILGEKEKSPVIERVENQMITEETNCTFSEKMSTSKDGEYCKEILEEIIGIPWRHNRQRDGGRNKEIMENQADTSLRIEYSSLILNSSNSPSKMYNIRLPLPEPPANIFDEGPCIEHHEEVLEESTSEVSSSIDTGGKPRIIAMSIPPEIKSLHKSLISTKRKSQLKNPDLYGESSDHTWDNENTSCEDKRSHSIRISAGNGHVMNAFYVDYNLVIVQEQLVAFWSQSALGNMLGSQDLWIAKGTVQRLLLDGNCVFKETSDMVISLDNSFAYVELWTKEHKSDKRERPLADVFATVYFWRHRQNTPDKKVLQLENINGKVNEVQYIVLRNSRNIVVSWVEIRDDMKKTVVHCYCLAPDYQTVVDIREMDTVDHSVTSLHNIEDCNNMVMGFGEQNVTLWNLEYGYVVATIEIQSPSVNPRCVWIKCDRGFLFILQHHPVDRLLVLIAVNGISHSWKRLQAFRAPCGYDGLRGVCIDNNVLAAFYQRGVLCWNIKTGESVIEEMSSQTTYIPCDKHVVMLNSQKVQVQQFLSYFITSFDLQ